MKRIIPFCLAVLALTNPAGAQTKTADAGWRSVRRLTAKDEVVVTLRGQPLANRRVLHAGDTSLTLLNLASATLSSREQAILLKWLEAHPRSLAVGAPLNGGPVTSDGSEVFVNGVRIAALDELVADVSRSNVLEINQLVRGHAAQGAAVMGVAGMIGGALLGFGIAGHGCHGEDCLEALKGVSVGAVIGAVGGARAGANLFGRSSYRVVYRAP